MRNPFLTPEGTPVSEEVRRRRTLALGALGAGFVMFLLAIVLAFAGGGGDDAPVGPATATTSTAERERTTPRRPPRRPAPPPFPAVPANAPGAHKAPREKVPILVYDVINSPRPDTADPQTWVPPEELEAQMSHLSDRGYHAVTLRQLWAAWKEGGLLPSKPVVISFDAGYHSVYASALPALRRRGWPGTLFLAPAQTEADFPLQEVKALAGAGWEIDVQGQADGGLTASTDEQLDLAVTGARRRVQRDLGVRAEFFSYPEGSLDERVVGAVEAAGFLGAVTRDEGLSSPDEPPYELKRVPVVNGDGAEGLARKLEALESQE